MNGEVYAPVTVTVTVTASENVSKFVEQEESSIMDSHKKGSSEWTNEKHNSYLKSIEASFVDQLYNSLDRQSSQAQRTCSSDAVSSWKNHSDACTPSGQFKVLQGGCWSKKSFNRENLHGKDADRPQLSRGSRWIQHFTIGSRQDEGIAYHCRQKRPLSTATSQQYPVTDSQFHEDPDCSNTEVTDQNFVEDTSCRTKRTKTSKVAHLSNDQVVPFCTSPASEIPDSYVSPKK